MVFLYKLIFLYYFFKLLVFFINIIKKNLLYILYINMQSTKSIFIE